MNIFVATKTNKHIMHICAYIFIYSNAPLCIHINITQELYVCKQYSNAHLHKSRIYTQVHKDVQRQPYE